MLSLSRAITVLHLALLAYGVPSADSFHESLTLHPLPDGKLSVLFEFTTYFSPPTQKSHIPQSHHSLTPPALLLPLVQNNVSELTISFVAGQWDQSRSSESGPLHYDSGGGGGEVRGWLRDTGDSTASKDAWVKVTHALGGLLCAGLGPSEDEDSLTTFGHIYPPIRDLYGNHTHFLLPHPFLQLCTENLTPFLSLLPSKGLSGLSSLLAQPGIIFSWGYKAEGIEVVMPFAGSQGRWRGWWEGVVDPVPQKGGSRQFSIQNLFRKHLPGRFPEADSSVLRLVKPTEGAGAEDRLLIDPAPMRTEGQWVDGRYRDVGVWNLLDESMNGLDVRFWWDGEDAFDYPRDFVEPPVQVTRAVTEPYASDGTLSIRISNSGADSRAAIYSEVWPWWVKGWMSEVSVLVEGQPGSQPDLLRAMSYRPSCPPLISSTSLHLDLVLPANSTIVLNIPFSKLTLRYTEHRPDAERGREIPSGILTLLDLTGEEVDEKGLHFGRINHRKSGRRRIYTPRLLLDVPTPDFSMPYNVIIMSSTVMAVFFGLMHGALTRRWGWVELVNGEGKTVDLDGGLNSDMEVAKEVSDVS